jgi:HPr serine kinase-like protein
VFYPLGCPVEIATNSFDVLIAARESWGLFEPLFGGTPLTIEIAVSGEGQPAAPSFHSAGSLLAIVSDSANFAVADLRGGFAFARLSHGAVGNAEWLRYHYLDALAYTMLDALRFTPVHAACIELNGVGILLAGETHAGKSSLAFACARAGWTFISDDASRLIRGEPRVVIGNPYQVRLRPEARELLPELAQWPERTRANGKRVIEIRTADLADFRTAARAEITHVVFLRREAGEEGLTPVSPETALRRMEQVIGWADPSLAAVHRSALEALLTVDLFELRYRDIDGAIGHLTSLARARSSRCPA